MTPEQKAREEIDKRLDEAGWVVQDMKQVNQMASLGVAVREYPTSTGPVDYALFIEGVPVGIVEAKKDDLGESIFKKTLGIRPVQFSIKNWRRYAVLP